MSITEADKADMTFELYGSPDSDQLMLLAQDPKHPEQFNFGIATVLKEVGYGQGVDISYCRHPLSRNPIPEENLTRVLQELSQGNEPNDPTKPAIGIVRYHGQNVALRNCLGSIAALDYFRPKLHLP